MLALRHAVSASIAQSSGSEYVAQDADERQRTVAQVSRLSWRPGFARTPRACNGTLVMMDDRRDAVASRPNGTKVERSPYYQKSIVLNFLYATRHGLGFMLVRPTAGQWGLRPSGAGLCPAWCRVKILASLVAARQGLGSGRCGPDGHWLVYIDGDAYVREQDIDLLTRLGDPLNSDTHFAIAREEPPAGAFRSPRRRPHGVRTPSLNAGVLFVRASTFSAQLLASWMRAADLPVCAPFRQSWPCEQQCLHELLRNRTLLPRLWRDRIATAPMQLFNSPWGGFIRHVWGGPVGDPA